jgi:hypothetical protein
VKAACGLARVIYLHVPEAGWVLLLDIYDKGEREDPWERAESEGLSAATLRRAKKELGVRSRWVTVDGRAVSYWLLSVRDLPAAVGPRPVQDEMNIAMQRLIERNSPRTPLEEDD